MSQQDTRQGTVLIHIWELLDPGSGAAVMSDLAQMLTQVAAEPGFVSARVLGSDDDGSIATLVEMRTPEERDRVEQLPIVRETLAHLHGTLNLAVKRYHEREAFVA
jgi:hypothetical protein